MSTKPPSYNFMNTMPPSAILQDVILSRLKIFNRNTPVTSHFCTENHSAHIPLDKEAITNNIQYENRFSHLKAIYQNFQSLQHSKKLFLLHHLHLQQTITSFECSTYRCIEQRNNGKKIQSTFRVCQSILGTTKTENICNIYYKLTLFHHTILTIYIKCNCNPHKNFIKHS
jgi:hypothetical protein